MEIEIVGKRKIIVENEIIIYKDKKDKVLGSAELDECILHYYSTEYGLAKICYAILQLPGFNELIKIGVKKENKQEFIGFIELILPIVDYRDSSIVEVLKNEASLISKSKVMNNNKKIRYCIGCGKEIPRFSNKQLTSGEVCDKCFVKVKKKCEAQRSMIKSLISSSVKDEMNKLSQWQVKEIVKNYSWLTVKEKIPKDPVEEVLNRLPQSKDIERGSLKKLTPILSNNLILLKNEECYYQNDVSLCTVKNVTVGSVGTYSGVSTRYGKGAYGRAGMSFRRTIRKDIGECFYGSLCITNKRIVFISSKNGFNKKLIDITAITPCDEGIEIQLGDKTYAFFTNEPIKIGEVISLTVGNSNEI